MKSQSPSVESAEVSGLVQGHYTLGGREYPCWQPTKPLRLIPEDLERLAMERDAIYQNWLGYSVKCSLKFWHSRPGRGWTRCQVVNITDVVDEHQWVTIGAYQTTDGISASFLNCMSQIGSGPGDDFFCAIPDGIDPNDFEFVDMD